MNLAIPISETSRPKRLEKVGGAHAAPYDLPEVGVEEQVRLSLMQWQEREQRDQDEEHERD